MEYRINFLIRILSDVFWFLAQIVLIEVIYSHVNTLGGWTVDQARVFLGILFLVEGIYMVLFSSNMDQLSTNIRNGQLDLLLTKPVDAQFMLSLQKVNVLIIFNLIFALSWFIWAVVRLPGGVSFAQLLWLLVLIPSGVLVIYCFRFFFACLSIFYSSTENLQYIWYEIYKLGTRPDAIYYPWLRLVLWTVLPVSLIASVPSRAIALKDTNPFLFIWALFMSGLLFWSIRKFLKRCLKNYTSASS